MAAAPSAKKTTKPAKAPPAPPTADGMLDGLLAAVGESGWSRLSFATAAKLAGVSLAQLYDTFPTKGSVVAAMIRRADRLVLANPDPELDDAPPRERLFDVLMRRFEALVPMKPAIRALFDPSRGDPSTCAGLSVVPNSFIWMLEAAGLPPSGVRGLVRLAAFGLLYTLVFRVWLGDDTPDLSRTMKALDQRLARAEQMGVFGRS